MSVETSLKGFRFLVSGSNRNWERETMNRLREKYMSKHFEFGSASLGPSTRLSTEFRLSFGNCRGRYTTIKEAVEPNREKGV